MDTSLAKLPDHHSLLFEPGLGKLKGYKASIQIDPQNFVKSVPYTKKEKAEAEMERLEKDGTIEQVQYADWVAPIANGKLLRICGDFKVTVNL